ncbi:hypothetical protein H2203_005545 [Taxawa tesnikishii (nom. ined.)]|nr:hypothetical protein H2203_005545 [Dothideales sp. JES 119]
MISGLPISDLKALRLTSRLFAAAGVRHLHSTVIVFHRADSIKRLLQIATHPVVGKQITTFVFDTHGLTPFGNYETWKRTLASGNPNDEDPFIQLWKDFVNKRSLVYDEGTDFKERHVLQQAQPELREAVEQYANQAQRQRLPYIEYESLRTEYDDPANTVLLRVILPAVVAFCPKLKHFVVSQEAFGTEGYNARRLALNRLEIDAPERYIGDRRTTAMDLATIVAAMEESGCELQSLTVRYGMVGWRGPRKICTLESLKVLRLDLRDVQVSWVFPINVPDTFAPNLEVLKMVLQDNHDSSVTIGRMFCGDPAICQPTWRHLKELSLNNFDATMEEITDMVMRHSATLEVLALDRGCLTNNGSWDQAFNNIAGKTSANGSLAQYQFHNAHSGDCAGSDPAYQRILASLYFQYYVLHGRHLSSVSLNPVPPAKAKAHFEADLEDCDEIDHVFA